MCMIHTEYLDETTAKVLRSMPVKTGQVRIPFFVLS